MAVNSNLDLLMIQLTEALEELPDDERIEAINHLNDHIMRVHPIQHPVSVCYWVPADQVIGNDYNPNEVAPPEMDLLHISIQEDGYTQPIVVSYMSEIDKYLVGDGFHRKRIGKEKLDIRKSTKGYLPVAKLREKTPGQLRATTIRHNRARGKHKVPDMVQIVADLLLTYDWTDEKIMKQLGMSADEVLRLKQQTGIAELFRNRQYSRSWTVAHKE